MLLLPSFPSSCLVRDKLHVLRGTRPRHCWLQAYTMNQRRATVFPCLFTIRDDAPTPIPPNQDSSGCVIISTTQQPICARRLPVVETVE